MPPEASAADSSFIGYVKSLGTPPEGTVRLFQRDKGEFYTCYGACAHAVALSFYRTLSVLKYVKSGGKEKDGKKKQFLRDFVLNGSLRIEIYAAEKRESWSFLLSASPGNTQPLEDLFDFSSSSLLSNPVLMALRSKNGKVGAAFLDTQERWMGVSEFEDDESFSNTESIVIQLGVKEVLLPSLVTPKRARVPKISARESSAGEDEDDAIDAEEDEAVRARREAEEEREDLMRRDWEGVKIRGVLERCGIAVVEFDKKKWNEKDVEKDVNRLLKGRLGLSSRPEFDMRVALPSLAAVFSYLSLTADESNFNTYTLITHDISKYMRLDGSALKALNLLPEGPGILGTGRGKSKNQSLFGLLNHCKTSQGVRELNRWLKQPLVDKGAILERQQLVELFFNDRELRTAIREDNLSRLPDLHRLAKKFQKGQASLEDVVRVYQAVLRIPETIELLENGLKRLEEEEDAENLGSLVSKWWLDGLKKGDRQCAKLVEMVETTVDLDQLSNHQFILRADFDTSLTEIKRKLDKVTRGIKEEQNSIADDLGLDMDGKTLHFEEHSLYGRCCRLTRKEAPRMQRKSGYIELSTQKAGVYFTTKKMKQYNENLKDYQKQFQRAQSGLVKQVISIAASYAPSLEALNKVIAHLDVIASFAEGSAVAPIAYIKPTLCDMGQGDLILRESRHPCLEVQDGIDFIPNDVQLTRGKSEFQIITGPNMGGKSTYIRQIGVIVLMAQIGCFVPCSEAQLPIFDSILARVGAGDSQIKGVSTFMAEMLETATILKSATRNSLIIIDELGRGTSTSDGFGLAWAISEHIATNIRAFCLFASHYHELTKLSEQVSHVDNIHVVCHVEEKEDTLTGKDITLLYRVEPGFSDQSFGIHVAQLSNFPEDVLKLAKRKADNLEDFGRPSEAPDYTAAEISDGIAVVQRFVQSWITKRAAIDEGMDVDGESKENQEQHALKQCWVEHSSELEKSPWVMQVLAQSY
ncbi:DNA mismatch repair protein [Atractiella rhizophila]|nr:DNA mismatch repair protein [Atractiella rhizophila]